MTVSYRIQGMTNLQATLKTLSFRTASHYAEAVREAATFLLDKSNEVVPVRTGHLKSTGYCEVRGVGFFTFAEVGYSAPYAIYVHENVHHSFGAGKMAKFLSWSALRYESEINDIIRKGMEPL